MMKSPSRDWQERLVELGDLVINWGLLSGPILDVAVLWIPVGLDQVLVLTLFAGW